jgi:hypothetical protein
MDALCMVYEYENMKTVEWRDEGERWRQWICLRCIVIAM